MSIWPDDGSYMLWECIITLSNLGYLLEKIVIT